MANFSKSDLKLTHYSWTAVDGDNPKVTGVPDSTLFNRQEGYEVLYMLNKVLKTLKSESKSKLNDLEDLVKDKLPGDTRQQKAVHDWLVENA